MAIAADLCIYTNHHFSVEVVHRASDAADSEDAPDIAQSEILPAQLAAASEDDDEDDDDEPKRDEVSTGDEEPDDSEEMA